MDSQNSLEQELLYYHMSKESGPAKGSNAIWCTHTPIQLNHGTWQLSTLLSLGRYLIGIASLWLFFTQDFHSSPDFLFNFFTSNSDQIWINSLDLNSILPFKVTHIIFLWFSYFGWGQVEGFQVVLGRPWDPLLYQPDDHFSKRTWRRDTAEMLWFWYRGCIPAQGPCTALTTVLPPDL